MGRWATHAADQEQGYFLGAMYVTYALGVAILG